MHKAFSFLALLLFSLLCAKELEVEVVAPSAILMNADTGAILFQKHAHVPSYPASITKVATVLFVLDHKRPSLEQMITVSGDALKMKPVKKMGEYPAHWLEYDGSRMGVKKGEILSLDTLLHGLMLVSGNDAANVIAESLSGSVPEFVNEMNQYVWNLGCKNTRFQNPHGLHHPDHFTTAYDICLITKKALSIPKFREIVSKVSYAKPKTNKQKADELRQTNPLIKPGKHYYEKAIGVKTGFTSNALNTYIGAATHEGRTLIAVLLACPKRTDRYKDAIRLFETAFQEKGEERRFFGPEHQFSREVHGAKVPLKASLQEDLAIAYFPSEEPSCRAFVEWRLPGLPVKKGQKVGVVQIKDEEGALLKEGDLLATEDLKGTFFFVLKETVANLFR